MGTEYAFDDDGSCPPVACRLNVGNLCETGRSTEPASPAASAEIQPPNLTVNPKFRPK